MVLAAPAHLIALIWYVILINQVRPSRSDVRRPCHHGRADGLFVSCVLSVGGGVVGVPRWRAVTPGGLPVAACPIAAGVSPVGRGRLHLIYEHRGFFQARHR